MFRPMRRIKRELTLASAKKLLHTARRGVLSVNGDDGYPYAIPINFYYDEKANKIFFHGAKAGHKVDALKRDDKVCFTVYGNETVKEEAWAPYVQSVVLFGRCHLLESTPENMAILKTMAMKYYPSEDLADAEIARDGKAVQLYEIEIGHLTGKQIQEK